VFYLDVAYVLVATYICCKRLFKIFHTFRTYVASVYLDVAYVAFDIHICCKRILHTFHDVCCRSASCCNINGHRKRAHAEAVPTGVAVPT
jgi:hypothetical protein